MAVTEERLVVEDQVLQAAPLYGHDHRPVNRVNRRDDSLRPRREPEGTRRAFTDS